MQNLPCGTVDPQALDVAGTQRKGNGDVADASEQRHGPTFCDVGQCIGWSSTIFATFIAATPRVAPRRQNTRR